MRTNGMSLHKLPLFVWAIFITAILLLLALPVLAGKIVPALNLAVCWELFLYYTKYLISCLKYKILMEDNQQVTLMKLISEWNLNDCAPELSISTLKMNLISPIFFSSYLAGLIEGDGTIIVPKTERSNKGKLNYPCVQIVFQLKDFPLCQVIQKLIGHGSISKKKQSAAYILTINNFEGLVKLCHLINGQIRGSKYYQIKLLIDYLNKKSSDLYIQPLGRCTTSLEKDSWLSGFIEADGSFQIRTSLNSKIPRISISFELVHSRITYYGYSTYDLMNQIAVFLEVNLNEIRNDRKYPQYRLRTNSLKTNIHLQDYLNKYPIRGTKYMDFQDWCRILNYFKEGTQMKNKEHIVEIKSQMNQNRIVYNWDHLQ